MSRWQSIATAPQDGRRIAVRGGTWVRGNRETLPQAFPSLVAWTDGDWVICDNEGPRSIIRGPVEWLGIEDEA